MKYLFKLGPNCFRGLIILIMTLGMFSALSALTLAEGSRTLYPGGVAGFRANIEWRTSFYSTLFRRRALFKVYAQAGEVILLGSSAVGVNNGDIRVFNPNRVTGPIGNETIPATPDFSCAAQRVATGNSSQGQITSRAQELAGPDTITDTIAASPGNAVPNGFVPCFYSAPETGIYHVAFFGPAGGNSDAEISPTGQVDLSNPANFDARQGTSIAAWDVTVRSALTSTADINGRLFVDYLTRFTGGWPRPVFSSYFMLTNDGYLYRVDMNGLDANGFIVYANKVGFLNSDGSPLYHDVVADPTLSAREQDQLVRLLGGVSLAPPSQLIFFNPPNPDAVAANNIPLTAIPPTLSTFEFGGRLDSNNTFVGGGGVFTFTTTITGIYRLIISRDGVDFAPDNPLNRVIHNLHEAGTQTINWDGLDNSGNPFPVGQNYQAHLIVRAGEHHFPILDPESSLLGGPSYMLMNPPGGECPTFNGGPPSCTTGFYDDRGYITANGTQIGTPGQALPDNTPPNPPSSDLLYGFDTTTNQRRYGDGTTSGFGDKKGLDMWTYYPSQPMLIPLNILPLNLALTKTDGEIVTQPGMVVNYTINYANTQLIDAVGVVITETVPQYALFDQAASLPTNWSCPDGSPAGTICTTNIGFVPNGTGGTVNFAVRVLNSVPLTVTQIENIAIIGEDKTRGPEPLADNIALDNTPLVIPTPTATPGSPTPTPTDVSGPPPAPTTGPPVNLTSTPIPPFPDGTSTPITILPPGVSSTLTPAPPGGVLPTPTLPVLLLPETGERATLSGLPWRSVITAVVIIALLLLIKRRLAR